MKNKILSFIFAFVCLFTCGICLVACGGNNSYQATLEADELYFSNGASDKTVYSTTSQVSLRGPAYYDYSEMKLLVDGREVDGLFTPSDINYGNSDVIIGFVNPTKLTSDATITVTGIKDRYAHFQYVSFDRTQEYIDLKARYESLLDIYTTNNEKANNMSLSEQEREVARIAASDAESYLESEFDGLSFNIWLLNKARFMFDYSIKLSEKDRIALTTAPLKDQVLDGTSVTYGEAAEDGYIGLNYLHQIKNNNEGAYQFEYTYKELTVWNKFGGYSMGMLPIRSEKPLGLDTVATHGAVMSDDTIKFVRVGYAGIGEDNKPIYEKSSDFSASSPILSVDECRSYAEVEIDDNYAHTLYLRMSDLKNNATFVIDPLGVEYSKFSLVTENDAFNGFVKLNTIGFTINGMGDQTYDMDRLGSIYIYTDEYGNRSVLDGYRMPLYKITVDANEAYFHAPIVFDGDNAKNGSIDWTSYLYYSISNNEIQELSTAGDDSNPDLIQVTRSMVSDLTNQVNVLLTENDIEYFYGVDNASIHYIGSSINGDSFEEFSARTSSHTFDILLDSDHNIDWTNAKVKVGGYVNWTPVNLVELTGDYGSYELINFKGRSASSWELKDMQVLRCTLNLYKGGSAGNVTSEEDIYYPIHFVNKSDLVNADYMDQSAFTRYFIKVEGADFSNATGLVKIKGSTNLNPGAFEDYQNSHMAVYKNTDGTAYTAVSDSELMDSDITGAYFAIYGQNFMSGDVQYISEISSITINVKKNGESIKDINVINYLTDSYKYNQGDPNIPMAFSSGNGGYYFTETDTNLKYHVFIGCYEVFDGRINEMASYITNIIVVVEDITGATPSAYLKGFFEFYFDFQ